MFYSFGARRNSLRSFVMIEAFIQVRVNGSLGSNKGKACSSQVHGPSVFSVPDFWV